MTIKRLLGLDTLASDYAYGIDPEAGYISEQRMADSWVHTTCGYCSVGCGMLVGVRDGRAVTRARQPRASGQQGAPLPKGLSEHHTLDAEGRPAIRC